jgi:hypothetical protein
MAITCTCSAERHSSVLDLNMYWGRKLKVLYDWKNVPIT